MMPEGPTPDPKKEARRESKTKRKREIGRKECAGDVIATETKKVFLNKVGET